MCCFNNISEQSNFYRFYPLVNPCLKKRSLIISAKNCPTIIFSNEEKQKIIKSLSNKKSLKRHSNKLGKQGRLVFRHIEGRIEILRHLPVFFDQHIQRRSRAGNESMFKKKVYRLFYEIMVKEMDPGQELRFSVLELDDRPIAYHFGFEAGGKFIWYKPSFDVELWKYSPGEVLIRNLLLYLSDREISEFDFATGDESFKYRFANKVRRNYTLYDFSPGFIPFLIKVKVKIEPIIKPYYHRARNFYGSIRNSQQV